MTYHLVRRWALPVQTGPDLQPVVKANDGARLDVQAGEKALACVLQSSGNSAGKISRPPASVVSTTEAAHSACFYLYIVEADQPIQ